MAEDKKEQLPMLETQKPFSIDQGKNSNNIDGNKSCVALQQVETREKMQTTRSLINMLSDNGESLEHKKNVCVIENSDISSPKLDTSEEEGSYDLCYNPFSIESETEGSSITSDCVLGRIGPFTDNRPICDCEIVDKMISSPDVRYLLSLLPDIAEMNISQKVVFKSKVMSLLDKVLEEKC